MFDEYWNRFVFQFNSLLPKPFASQRSSNYVSVRLTRDGLQFALMLLFVVFAAILQSINLLVLMAGAMMAMLLVQWRLTSRTLLGIRMQRLLPSSLQARKPFSVQLTIENPRLRLGSWLLMIHDQLVPKDTPLGPGATGHGINILVDRLLPCQSRLLDYSCTLPFRGSYRFNAPELTTRFPLSLMRGTQVFSLSQTVIVHPTQGRIDQHWRESLKLPVHGRCYRHSASAGGDGEFHGLRDYLVGDPIRHVHWRTSAKRGQLVIRQFEREESQSISLVLDILHPSPDSNVDSAPQELAIELVASILAKVISVERSVATLTVVDKHGPIIARIQTTNQLSNALDRLALVVASKQDHLATAIRQTIRYSGGHDPIVVISTRSRSDFRKNETPLPGPRYNDKAASSWTNDSPVEGAMLWIDVTSDRLDNYFVRG